MSMHTFERQTIIQRLKIHLRDQGYCKEVRRHYPPIANPFLSYLGDHSRSIEAALPADVEGFLRRERLQYRKRNGRAPPDIAQWRRELWMSCSTSPALDQRAVATATSSSESARGVSSRPTRRVRPVDGRAARTRHRNARGGASPSQGSSLMGLKSAAIRTVLWSSRYTILTRTSGTESRAYGADQSRASPRACEPSCVTCTAAEGLGAT